MPVEKRVVPIPLGVGVDAGQTDPKQARQLLQLENARFDRAGELRKRHGLAQLSGTHTDDYMATYRDNPLIIGESIKSYDGSGAVSGNFDEIDTGIDLWDVDGPVLYGGASPSVVRYPSAALGGDHVVSASVHHDEIDATNYLNIVVFNRYSGLIEETDKISCDSNNAWVSYFNSAFHIVYFDTNGDLAYITFASGAAIGSPTAFTATRAFGTQAVGGAKCPTFDAAYMGDANHSIAVVYEEEGSNLNVAVIDTVGASAAELASTIAVTDDVDAVGCRKFDTGEVLIMWVDYNSGTTVATVKAAGYDTTPANSVSITTVETLSAGERVSGLTIQHNDGGSSSNLLYSHWNSSTNVGTMRRALLTDTGGTGSVSGTQDMGYGGLFSTKPFADSTDLYIGVLVTRKRDLLTTTIGNIPDSTGTQVLCKVDISNGVLTASLNSRLVPVGQWAVGRAAAANDAAWTGGGNVTIEVQDLGSKQWLIPSMEIAAIKGEHWNTVFGYYTATRISAQAQGTLQTKEIDQSLLIPNALPYIFDGKNCVEQGFLLPPHLTAAEASGSGSLGAGDYSAVCVYEWFDARGQRHLSEPSVAVSVTIAANKDIDWTVHPLPLSMKSDVNVLVYRTTAGGNQYLFAGRVKSEPNSGSKTLTDSDTDISTNEQLYALPAEANANAPVPRTSRIEIFQNRQFLVDRRYPKTDIWYSKEMVAGVPPEFTGGMTVILPRDGGDIEAIARLYDKMVVFKKSQIWTFHGRGRDARGGGVGYATPFLVSNAHGCTSHKSVVLTPAGLMFLSHDGIYLLTANLQVLPIGRAVKYHTDSLTIVAAALCYTQNTAVFLMSSGLTMVYNYLFGQWSTYTGYAAKDACVARSGHLYFKDESSDVVFVENPSATTDPSSANIDIKVETGWLAPAAFGGFSRVYRFLVIGQNIDSHTLRVKTAYDYEPHWTDDQTYDTTQLTAFASSQYFGAGLAASYQDQAYLVEVHTSRQKCTAIRFQLTDEDNAGENLRISGLAMLVGVKTGPKRLGSARNV